MTFSRDIPNDLPPPKEIVGQIRTNFSQYATIFDNNHIPINAAKEGKHSNVLFENQATNPVINSAFTDLFSKLVSSQSGNIQQVFAMIPQFLPDQFPNTPQQLTFNSVSNTAQFHTFLPGGYIVYFDTIPSTTGVPINTQITLVPTPSEILCVIPNPTLLVGITGTVSGPLRIAVTINTNDKFTINAQASIIPNITGDINWIAIARQ